MSLCITEVLVGVHNEVCGFCYKNGKHKQPPYDWTSAAAASVLQSYPAGVSRSVLLTELEHKWRSAVRRGENAGKLKRVLASNQLALHEMLDGALFRVDDDFRFRFESDGAGVDFIMHQQSSDFVQYCRHHAFEPLHERRVLLTQCRLNFNPVMLLPTPLFNLVFDMGKAADARFVADLLLPMYRAFCANPCPEQQAPHLTRALFCQVVKIGPVTQHPTNPGPYRVVQLSLSSQLLVGSVQADAAVEARTIFLLLVDDKVGLAGLWAEGDNIFLYRPYVEPNDAEELFGRRVAFNNVPLQYDEVARPDRMLEGASTDPRVLPVHLLVSAVTVCATVLGPESSNSPSQAVPVPFSGPTRLHLFLQDALIRPFSQVVRLVREEDVASSAGAASRLRFLWVEPEAEAGKDGGGGGDGRTLVRVRCAAHLLCPRQAGQLLLLDGLVAEPEEDGEDKENSHTSAHGGRPFLRLSLGAQLPVAAAAESKCSVVNVSRLAALLHSPSIFRLGTLRAASELALAPCCMLVLASVLAIAARDACLMLRLHDGSTHLEAQADEYCVHLSQSLPLAERGADPDKSSERWKGREYAFMLSYVQAEGGGVAWRVDCVSDVRDGESEAKRPRLSLGGVP